MLWATEATRFGFDMQTFTQTLKRASLVNNGILFAVITTLFWAGNVVAGKFAVGQVSPLMLTMCRWLIAIAVMLLIGWRHVVADRVIIKQNIVPLFFYGAFGFAAFNGLYYCSLNFTTAVNVAILQAAMPMFVFALNFCCFGFRIHWAHAAGYSITFIGVLLIATNGNLGQLSNLRINLGDMLILSAVVIYAIYSVALHAKPKMHWISFMTVLSGAAAVVSAPMAAAEYYMGNVIMPTTLTAWSIIFYTAVFPSIISQSLWLLSNERLGSNTASLFLNLVPVFGALLAVIFLGETFHAYHAFALAMVISGVIIAQRLAVHHT